MEKQNKWDTEPELVPGVNVQGMAMGWGKGALNVLSQGQMNTVVQVHILNINISTSSSLRMSVPFKWESQSRAFMGLIGLQIKETKCISSSLSP